jgi:hypothetical protein
MSTPAYDVDGDGCVGLGDIAVITSNWATPGCWVPGDIDGSGFNGQTLPDSATTLADIAEVTNHWGEGCSSGFSGGESMMSGGSGALGQVLAAFGHDSYESLAAYADSLPGDAGTELLNAFAIVLAAEGGGGSSEQ